MTSSNVNIFHVTGPLCGEFTGHRWIPLTKASDAQLWHFLWSAPEQMVVQTIETPVICDLRCHFAHYDIPVMYFWINIKMMFNCKYIAMYFGGGILGDLIYNNSTLLQIMVWCHEATSHYLNQLWLTISEMLEISILYISLKIIDLRLQRYFPGSNELIAGYILYLEGWNQTVLGSTVSHYRVIVGLGQSAPAVGWGSLLHAWLASVNWISGARCLNRRYPYGACGMHYHILLRQYS